MCDEQDQPFQMLFSGLLRGDSQALHLTSDGGLVLARKFDERLSFRDLVLDPAGNPRPSVGVYLTGPSNPNGDAGLDPC